MKAMLLALLILTSVNAPVPMEIRSADSRPCAAMSEYREVQDSRPGTKRQVDRIFDIKGRVIKEGPNRLHAEHPTCAGARVLVVYDKPDRSKGQTAKLWILIWWEFPA